MKLKVAIVGASGYVGGELLRVIASHPMLEVKTLTANTNAGQKISVLHPHLSSFRDFQFQETTKENLQNHDVVFLALPHTKSAEVSKWFDGETLVIDCGADFRLEDAVAWQKFYGTEHQAAWPYGMPELLTSNFAEGGTKAREQLAATTRIAVPGCNATAVTLAFAPALAADLIEPQELTSVLSVGTSGAGRNASVNLLASEINAGASAYQVGGVHRHIPEIQQNLNRVSTAPTKISFTPVLVPMTRGIIAVNTAKLKPGVTLDQLRAAFEQAYGDEEFVRVLPAGEFPNTKSTLGANLALIGLAIDEDANRAVIISAIDNLVKGTAGAAVQSMNIALGFDESTGLAIDGVAP
jgi:N-acetyl-gamma-glutamyl-phosphate reductase